MKEKLYVKLANGRYQEYREPEPPHKNALYVKEGNRYVPWAMELRGHDALTEGVWVVTKHLYGNSMSSGKYLDDSFLCMKVGDIVNAPSLIELGGYEKLSSYLCEHWGEVDKRCVDTMCKSIVGILMQYKNQKKEENV